MIRVLVVDDETIMREAFSRLFDWESYGLVSAGQAKNGREALKIIIETDVDIVITDLKMPVMNGLELIAEAQKIKPQLKFVVLSAYDSFELVSEAFKLGVKDYFLKVNLDADKVLSVLSKLAEEIKKERLEEKNRTEERFVVNEQMQKLKKLEATVAKNKQVLKEQLFKKMFWNKNADVSALEQLKDAGVVLSGQRLCVMVLMLENYYEVEKAEWNGERELLKFGIVNLIEEVLQSESQTFCFCSLPHEYVVIYSCENRDGDNYAKHLYSTLKEYLERFFRFVTSAGVSDEADGFASCLQLYQEARRAYEYSFVLGKGILISHDTIRHRQIGKIVDFVAKAEGFKEFLSKAIEPEQLLTGISVYRLDSSRVVPEDEKVVRELFYVYYYEILAYVKKNNLIGQQNIKAMIDSFTEVLKDGGTLSELNRWLVSILELLAEEMDQTGIASRAKRYINQNYSRDIVLRDVAEYLGISESYLSRVFKKETGGSFSNYILNVRIEAAVNLMKNTNYKVYQIAEMVGYNNVEYFSKMFKKVTGKSPSAF